jgi:hypothetical protein
MFTALSFSWTKNSVTACCLKRESATDVILKIHHNSAICRNDSKLGMCAGETPDFKPSKLHFSIFVNGWGNNVGQNFLNNLRIFLAWWCIRHRDIVTFTKHYVMRNSWIWQLILLICDNCYVGHSFCSLQICIMSDRTQKVGYKVKNLVWKLHSANFLFLKQRSLTQGCSYWMIIKQKWQCKVIGLFTWLNIFADHL